MARSPKRLKFFVQVARPRIDTDIVEVEATDDDDAEHKALEMVERMPREAWTATPFDPNVYQPHVETMIAEDEFSAMDVPSRERAAELLAETETRYLLLKADCDSAEGVVMLQPWFVVDQPNLLASELCRDWIGSLNELGLTHMSERLDDLAGGSPMMPSDLILFDPRQPKKRDD